MNVKVPPRLLNLIKKFAEEEMFNIFNSEVDTMKRYDHLPMETAQNMEYDSNLFLYNCGGWLTVYILIRTL